MLTITDITCRVAGRPLLEGASLTLRVLSNAGDRPNDAAGTLSGVDNIEG